MSNWYGYHHFVICFLKIVFSLLTLYAQSHYDIETQVRHLQQKYMGIRPQKHEEAMFNTQDIKPDGGHPVPINVCISAFPNSNHN